MSLDLQILPIEDTGLKITQKCKVPSKLFPKELHYGDPVILNTSSGLKYIARIFPFDSDNSSCCYLEPSVSVLINESCLLKNQFDTEKRLVKIEQIEFEKDPVKSIAVQVIFNHNIFKCVTRIKSVMEDIVRDLLEPYYLMSNCCIELAEEEKSFGITEIIVKSSSGSSVFTIGSSTNVVIEDVKMKTPECVILSELEGIEDCFNEIDAIIYNWKILNDFKWRVKPSLNALVLGPTGSGKTSLCNNFMLKHSCNVFIAKPSNIVRQYPGETEEILRSIFHQASTFVNCFKPKGPTVIFVEDVELICPSKPESQDAANINRICGQFCSLLDEIYNIQGKVIVLGTSSNADMINAVVRRPGRFEKEICLSVLNDVQREQILNVVLSKPPWKMNENICKELSLYLAKCTPGFVAADILLLARIAAQKKTQSFGIQMASQESYADMQHHFLSVLKSIKPTCLKGSDVSVYKSDQYFGDLGGMEDLKQTLKSSVLAGLKNPEAFRRFGLQLPKGILLYGPPGCAKTTIAKCLANEAKMTLIATSGAEVYSPYVGNSEKFISKIFDVARKNAPCLIFLDEIDALVGNRKTTSKNDVQTRVLSTLLTEIDGIGIKIHSGTSTSSNNNILVVAATNRPDMIDKALMRPGRFDKLIHVPPPDRTSRIAIFNIHKKTMPFDDDVDIELLADRTLNFSGADICNLCNEAALHAFTEDFNSDVIKEKHFTIVLNETRPTLTENQISWYCDFKKKYMC